MPLKLPLPLNKAFHKGREIEIIFRSRFHKGVYVMYIDTGLTAFVTPTSIRN